MTTWKSSQTPVGSMSLYNDPFKKKKVTDLTAPQTTPVSSTKINLPESSPSSIPNINDSQKYGFTQNKTANDWSPKSLLPKSATPYTSTIPTADEKPPVDNTTTPTVKQPSAYETYMASVGSLANKRKQQAGEQYASNVDYETTTANTANDALTKSVDPLKANLDTFKTNIAASVAKQKQNVENSTGEAQLLAAKTRAESEARNSNRHAALNTTDSYGVGSLDEKQTNTESDFNKFTQQNLQDKNNKFAEIDTKAESDVTTEIQKFNDYVSRVQSSMTMNNAQKDKAIRDARYATQEAINAIDDYTNGIKYQYIQSQGTANLSPEFMATGKPTTPAEFEFLQKNKDAFANIGGGGKSASRQEISGAINDVLSGNVDSIFGWGNVNPLNKLPGSDAQNMKAKVERLKSLVSLENANKLKGQGAISESERQLLANASTILNNPNISPEQAKIELNRLSQSFSGNPTTQTIRVKDLKTGQTGTLPADEFDPSLYQQI